MFGNHGESVNRVPTRQRIWIVAALVGGLLFGWIAGVTRGDVGGSSAAGRYQFQTLGGALPVVFDPRTGEMWIARRSTEGPLQLQKVPGGPAEP